MTKPTRTSERVLVVVLVALLGAIAVVIATSSTSSSGPRGSSAPSPSSNAFDGPTLPPHLRAADFSLRDQNGRRVTLSQYRGKVVVVTFIHSLCKDICPFMVEQVKGALNELPRYRGGIPVIGISADPAQDTVAHRKAFLSKHEMTGRMSYVNGSTATMRQIWHDWHVRPVVRGNDAHSTFIFLIDKRGYERVGFPGPGTTPDQLAHDLRLLEREPA
jgi:protein SCO1/2